MKVVYKIRARKVIASVAEYVESKNTEGSGDRWAQKLAATIELLALSKAKFALCRNPSLSKFGYRCYFIMIG